MSPKMVPKLISSLSSGNLNVPLRFIREGKMEAHGEGERGTASKLQHMNATIFLEIGGTRPLGPGYGCKNVVAVSVDLLLNLPR